MRITATTLWKNVSGVLVPMIEGTSSTLAGGTSTGDDLILKANTTDTNPQLSLEGDNIVQVTLPASKNFIVRELSNNFLTLNRSGSTYECDSTTTFGFTFDLDTINTGDGLRLSCNNVSSGNSIRVLADSDELTTGSLFTARAGTARNKNWFNIIKNSADTEGCQVQIDRDNVTGHVTKPALTIGTAESGLYQIDATMLGVAIAGTLAVSIEAPASLGATETSLWLYDLDNNAVEQVTVGAADSGGAGFKVLRIPN